MPCFWIIPPSRWIEDEQAVRECTDIGYEAGCRGVIVAPKKPDSWIFPADKVRSFNQYLASCGERGIAVKLDVVDISKKTYGDPAKVTLLRDAVASEGGKWFPGWSAPDDKGRVFSERLEHQHGTRSRLKFTLARPAKIIYRTFGSDDVRLAAANLPAGEHSLDLWCPFGMPLNTLNRSAGLTDMQVAVIFDGEAEAPTNTRWTEYKDPALPVALAAPAICEGRGAEQFVDWLPTWGDWPRCPRWESEAVRVIWRNNISWAHRAFALKHECVKGFFIGGNEPRGYGDQGTAQARYISAGAGCADAANACAARVAKVGGLVGLNWRYGCLSWGDPVWTVLDGPGSSQRGGGFRDTRNHLNFDLPHEFIWWTGAPNYQRCLDNLRSALAFCASRGAGLYGGPGAQLSAPDENKIWAAVHKALQKSPLNVYFFDWIGGNPNWTVANLKEFIGVWTSK